jgi:proteic killer suppression protein
MEVNFDDKKLLRLYTELGFSLGFPADVERGFRKVVGLIRTAPNERVLAGFVGLRMEKLKGKRAHQRALRINKQWRVIIELHGDGDDKVAIIMGIEDYH